MAPSDEVDKAKKDKDEKKIIYPRIEKQIDEYLAKNGYKPRKMVTKKLDGMYSIFKIPHSGDSIDFIGTFDQMNLDHLIDGLYGNMPQKIKDLLYYALLEYDDDDDGSNYEFIENCVRYYDIHDIYVNIHEINCEYVVFNHKINKIVNSEIDSQYAIFGGYLGEMFQFFVDLGCDSPDPEDIECIVDAFESIEFLEIDEEEIKDKIKEEVYNIHKKYGNFTVEIILCHKEMKSFHWLASIYTDIDFTRLKPEFMKKGYCHYTSLDISVCNQDINPPQSSYFKKHGENDKILIEFKSSKIDIDENGYPGKLVSDNTKSFMEKYLDHVLTN